MLSVPVPGGGSGKWYCKAPLANDFIGQVQAKSKKMSGRKSVSWTLYFTTHVAAICVKSLTSSEKSPKILWGSQRWLCQVCLYLMCHLQQLDLPSQNLGRITYSGGRMCEKSLKTSCYCQMSQPQFPSDLRVVPDILIYKNS